MVVKKMKISSETVKSVSVHKKRNVYFLAVYILVVT